MKFLLLLLSLPLFIYQANAQGTSLTGTVVGAHDNVTLPVARVVLTNLSDSATTATATDMDGKFKFAAVAPGQYTILVNYIGFKPYKKAIKVQDKPLNLGQLLLDEESSTLGEVEVVGRMPMGEQKGDTTQFNAAAFKVAPDASVEDLVQKMPGITIEDGKIQAQGEDVLEVMVDGKRYFGGDAEAALRNLPAEVVKNIQIFDKLSDQAEFSGVDDGNRIKTINIVTKPERRKGQFGKVSAGYGNNDRYMVGANINAFSGERRFTFTGITNNINLQDYSAGEAPGGGMRGRRGGGNGNMTTDNFGLNYNESWGEKIEVSGNYNYFKRRSEDYQSINREFISPDDLGQQYMQSSQNTNMNLNHRMNMRIEYKINDANRLLITPNFSYGQNEHFGYRFGRTVNDEGELNQSENTNRSDNQSLYAGNNIHYRHRFNKQGRTFSTSVFTSYNTNSGEAFRQQDNVYYQDRQKDQHINQFIANAADGHSWRSNFSFSEPVGDSARIRVAYKVSNRINDSDRRTYDYFEQTQEYEALNTEQSNTFISDYLTQEFETNYRYNTKKLRFQFGAEYQLARLQNTQEFPQQGEMDRTFYSLLPSAQLEYRFSPTQNLRIEYRTNTDAPSIGQLQEVIDISDPFRIRTGNPDLKQTYQNRVWMRYRSFNKETNKVFSLSINGSLTQNNITNNTFRYDPENPITYGDRELSRGQQLILPVNVDGNWNMNTYFNYGQPLGFLPLKVDVNGSLGYARRPSMLNNVLNFTNTNNFRLGTSLSSNISENIDFSVSTSSRYNIVNNTLRQQNNNFFSQITRLRASLNFWENIVYRTELRNQVNTGLAAGFNNNFTIWNMSVSKKVLPSQQAELSLSVNDLLGQNNSIRRNVSEQYIEDVQSTVLQRFFMFTFAYNIRSYGGPSSFPESSN